MACSSSQVMLKLLVNKTTLSVAKSQNTVLWLAHDGTLSQNLSKIYSSDTLTRTSLHIH